MLKSTRVKMNCETSSTIGIRVPHCLGSGRAHSCAQACTDLNRLCARSSMVLCSHAARVSVIRSPRCYSPRNRVAAFALLPTPLPPDLIPAIGLYAALLAPLTPQCPGCLPLPPSARKDRGRQTQKSLKVLKSASYRWRVGLYDCDGKMV